jgi:hypothetical protein
MLQEHGRLTRCRPFTFFGSVASHAVPSIKRRWTTNGMLRLQGPLDGA